MCALVQYMRGWTQCMCGLTQYMCGLTQYMCGLTQYMCGLTQYTRATSDSKLLGWLRNWLLRRCLTDAMRSQGSCECLLQAHLQCLGPSMVRTQMLRCNTLREEAGRDRTTSRPLLLLLTKTGRAVSELCVKCMSRNG